jgi:hypothetical protein
MKLQSLISLLIFTIFTSLNAQTIWERTFAKAGYDFKDYSITTAGDGSEDMLLAGTLHNKVTDEYQAHIIRIDNADASIVFEQTYQIGNGTWAMSIAPFLAGGTPGYAVTGYAEIAGVRRTVIFTIDGTGNLQLSRVLEQGNDPNLNGMGLHIKATPNVTGQGFVLVGMIHEDTGLSSLQNTQKQGFCVKLDQSLSVTWEQYFEVPLGNMYLRDYDVASHVTLTDQGYFITGGKNILTGFGLQRQGILALMLDPNGTELWDASYYTGNSIDNGASAYYDQAAQQVYVLTNISVTHHLGISVFDAATGALDNTASFESFSANFDLDKYGHTMVKAPFTDKLLIQGRGRDGQWADDEGRGQPAFLVDYDLSTQAFGVHYAETNVSQALNGVSTEAPFFPGALRTFYYPQSLVNINAQHSAMASYTGAQGQDISLVVRQFAHLNAETYEFCGPRDTLVLDTLMEAFGFTGGPLAYNSPASAEMMPPTTVAPEGTGLDTLCFSGEEGFFCEGNLVQNGDFETGTPTTGDEDISNAANWGGIWSNAGAGASSADFYSDLTGVPASLTAPLPLSQGQFAGFWSRIQGGDVYREGVLNELSTTILPNTGVYELEFKIACLFSPNTPASLSVFLANGSINGGAAVTSGTVPLNTALFADSWEVVVEPILSGCDNNFTTYTYIIDSSDPAFPASGANALFFTRTDGVQPGAYLALDDVCLHSLCCRDEAAFDNAVQNGFAYTTNGHIATLDNPLLTHCSEVVIDWGDGQTEQVNAQDMGVTHTFASSGVYIVHITVLEYGADGAVCFEDDICMGLTNSSDLDWADGLKLFPNPAAGRLYLEWNAPGRFVQGRLINTNAQAVRAFRLQGQRATVNLNGLPPGMYLVQLLTAEGRQVVRKLVKE